MKLFNFVKGIFGRSATAPVTVDTLADEAAVEMQPELAEARYAEPVQTSAAPVARLLSPAQAPEVDVNNSEVVLPLASILPALPAELQQRVLSSRVENTTVALPIAQVLAQLPQGCVRVPFGEIRKSEPTAFSGGADRDNVLVSLPLGELISRLAPLLGTLRPARKHIEVPDEIVSPFASRGDGLSIGKAPATPGTGFSTRPRGAQSSASVPPAGDLRARGSLSVPPQQPPACTPGTAFIVKKTSTPAQPAAPLSPNAGASLPPGRGAGAKAPIGMMPLGGFAPTPPPSPVNGSHGKGHTEHIAASAPIPMPSAPAAPSTNSLTVDFAAVEPSLPEEIRLEAGQMNLAGTKLALPQDLVAECLKRGKVAFAWKQIRGWLVPAVAPAVSAHDGLLVSLPLAVIAPLFLASDKDAVGKKRVVVDDRIPNLFFGFPQPEAAGAAVPAPPVPAPVAAPAPVQREIPVVPAPKPAETNYFVFDDVSDTAVSMNPDARPSASSAAAATVPGTNFVRRKATPNEVVTKASLLEGVYGALVALPDGLLVAAKLDPSHNGETIAALIPQMYSKLSGCTKELRMGELNNLNFTVGNVPWKIFRVNGIFFAAFGTTGEPLPTAHLTELARELDYKKAQ